MIYKHTSVDELFASSLAARLRAAGIGTLLDLARAHHSLDGLTREERAAVRALLSREDVRRRLRTLIA